MKYNRKLFIALFVVSFILVFGAIAFVILFQPEKGPLVRIEKMEIPPILTDKLDTISLQETAWYHPDQIIDNYIKGNINKHSINGYKTIIKLIYQRVDFVSDSERMAYIKQYKDKNYWSDSFHLRELPIHDSLIKVAKVADIFDK